MKPTDFFDLTEFEHKAIFEGVENVWEALEELSQYIDQLFFSGKIVGNFAADVYVHPEAEIDPSTRILGPAIICKKAKVRYNAFIRENVIVGENSVIGHAVEVKNTIILNNSTIAHFNHVGDSIIGGNINIAGGAQLANLRLDQNTVSVELDGQKINTGLKKLGAIIGDNSQIGANAVLNPGTILGKESIVYPLALVSHTHPTKSIIK